MGLTVDGVMAIRSDFYIAAKMADFKEGHKDGLQFGPLVSLKTGFQRGAETATVKMNKSRLYSMY